MRLSPPGQRLRAEGAHLLASALERPATSYNGVELYPNVFEKAAVMMQALVQNHPFTDGNKRTAYTCTAIFLRMNGYRINPLLDDQPQADFVISVASHFLTTEQIQVRAQLEQWSSPGQ